VLMKRSTLAALVRMSMRILHRMCTCRVWIVRPGFEQSGPIQSG
jgi:hypothetical protein